MKRPWIAVMALFGVAAMLGCGAKSRPIPPERTHPERVNDLSAKPDPQGVRLTWSRPMKYSGGKTLRDLAGFRLMRAEGEGPFSEITDLPVTDQERFRKAHRFAYIDTTAALGHSYRYVIVAETSDGYQSDPSNVTKITPAPTQPPNPENFTLPAPTPIPAIPPPPT
jgi:hypothetical protein